MNATIDNFSISDQENSEIYEEFDDGGNVQITNFSTSVPHNANDPFVRKRVTKHNKTSKHHLKRGIREVVEFNTTTIDNKYPIACTLDFSPLNITNYDLSPILRPEIDFPQFRFGFFHWIHASRNKTVVFDDFKERKRIYRVINGYEPKIDDSNESISDNAVSFLPNKPVIIDPYFYKIWELLHYYDVCNDANFISVHLGGKNLASCIQATMLYRQIYAENKKDKYYGCHINSDTTTNKQFIDYHMANKGPIYIYNNAKSIGDTINSAFVTNFKKFVDGPANLITSCIKWRNSVVQEQESAKLIIGQIVTALHLQKKGGCLILMMFENFTLLSIKILILLKYFYETVDIIKPLASRESYPDRYIVCKKYKGCDKLSDYMALLNDITGNQMLIDIFPRMEVPVEVTTLITSINTQLTNRQFKVINKMIDFIEAKNFYGEMYQQYRERQINLAKHWTSHFFTNVSNNTTLLQHAYDDHAKILKNLKSITLNLPHSNNISQNIKTTTKTKKKKTTK